MRKYLCGVDVGGTKLSAGIFQNDGTLIDSITTHNHTSLDCEGITELIVRLIQNLLADNKIDVNDLHGVGIGIAGHINSKKGMIITSSNFKTCFNNYPMREKVARKIRTNIIVDNDANAQAYGEYLFGAGKGFSNIIFITLSTGIGCGMIVDNKLIRGMSGTAGEIGHTIIDPHSDIQCSCGNYGCLMSLSSGQYLHALYKRYLKAGYASGLGLDIDTVDEFDGVMLRRGIEMGDEISEKVLLDSANTIGNGLYNLFQIMNPEIFILGGGLIHIGEIYINLIERQFLSLVKKMMYDKVEIRSSALGDNAGLIGAAALTLE